ncbi:hypothetical protein [Streptomyces sp. CL12-4]|jgi:hypothetical protein|uniref:hypothetical protein n=1 Tax=Streptomyces sp. CL12-4 TaxID=2810306 RepID=UPI001EFB4CAE|nr:hypothetical protein [Streptomyces sp. CL12-4]MCG8971535.1 hypothetical protein [Streptomyces sp. CL12-4]
MKKLSSRIAITTITVGAALASVTPAQAGIIDGTLNNVSSLTQGNVLGSLLNSALQDSSNNNANTKASGKENNAVDN